MLNSEPLSDVFRAVVSEDECLDMVGRDTESTHCSMSFSQDQTCSSLNKSVQVNVEDDCGSKRLCTSTNNEKSGNSREKNTSVSVLVRKSDSSSLDLHLSSESEERAEDAIQDQASTDLNKESSEDCCLTESSSSSITSEKPLRVISSSPSCEISPDIFENSGEVFSQNQLFDSATSTSSEVLPDGSPEIFLSQADNRETDEEWSSQDLSNVSKNLKIRRKQIKRLIAAVIRKRQMEDETLEAFKKRLKRM